MSANAYTVGQNIVFGAGRFAPETNEGRRLIAHELTHIIQQSGGATAIQRTPAADLRWRQDVNAARYRGQLIANRIRIHTKLSKEARAKINSELAYFEGAAKEAYVKEVRPALLAVAEIEMLPEQPVPGGSPPMGSDSGNPDPTTSDPAVFFNCALSDPNYIDNSIKEVNFFGAELAIIHYKDGSKLELGLVPKWMKPPFVEVDYHTPREDYKPLHNPGKSFSFFRDSDLQNVPRNMPWADVQTNYGRPVSFSREGQSGRFVPSIVNMLTAPNLCKVLLDSERRFVVQTDEVAEWGAQVAGVIAWMPAGGWVKGPANFVKGAGAVARWPRAMAARKLAGEMDSLLKTGGAKTITVEGVVFADVRAVAQGRNLAVSRFSSHVAPALRGQGQGSLINAAFEEAAVAAARMNGLKTVTIDVGIIVNPGWRVLLESRGYVKTMTQTADGFSNGWVKTIKL